MGFNRRKMEDQRQQVAENEAVARRATDAQVLEDVRRRHTNESSVSIPRSEVPNVAIIGATSSRSQCDTVSAIGQRSTADGDSTT
jgi:hypothetical protein